MEKVTCPICSSSHQKESQTIIKYTDLKQINREVPCNFYLCQDCGEDWQTSQQHLEFNALRLKIEG